MKRKFVYTRVVDRLGRIVIPIEMRRAYDLNVGEEVMILPTEDGIIIKCLADAKDSVIQEFCENKKKP